MFRTATVLLAVLAAAVTLWLLPAEAAAPRAAGVSPQSTYEGQIFSATNRQRKAHDRAVLKSQPCVKKFAVKQARRMARQDRMFHQSLGPILRRCGLNTAGENVAYGFPSGKSVVNDGWMNSDGHRANILNRGFRLLGAGARKSADGTWYAAQVFGRKS